METENLKEVRKDKAEEFLSMWVKWLENFEYENDSSTFTWPKTAITGEAVMRIYPNPAVNNLQIDISPNKAGQIKIFDSSGRLVITQTVFENIVDVSGLKRGMYFVDVSTEQGIIYQQKIFKQ